MRPFREFADLIEMEATEVYGEPSELMLEQLQDKADALGGMVGSWSTGCTGGSRGWPPRPRPPVPPDTRWSSDV